jgi:hypothetical protein
MYGLVEPAQNIQETLYRIVRRHDSTYAVFKEINNFDIHLEKSTTLGFKKANINFYAKNF